MRSRARLRQLRRNYPLDAVEMDKLRGYVIEAIGEPLCVEIERLELALYVGHWAHLASVVAAIGYLSEVQRRAALTRARYAVAVAVAGAGIEPACPGYEPSDQPLIHPAKKVEP